MRSLQKKIDELPKQAEWIQKTVTLEGDASEEHLIQFRNPIEAIKSLWSDPSHMNDLKFAPEQHYSSPDRKGRIYNEMWTGKWWQTVQVCVLPFQPVVELKKIRISSWMELQLPR